MNFDRLEYRLEGLNDGLDGGDVRSKSRIDVGWLEGDARNLGLLR